MNLRNPLLLGAMIALGLLAGCTAYTNKQTCLDQTRTSYKAIEGLPLKVSNVSIALAGARVVVEGTIVAPPAPKIRHASGASGASGASAASGSQPASQAVVRADSATSVTAASAASAAAMYPVPPGNAAAECIFEGKQLRQFHWLTPAQLVKLVEPL